MSPAHPPRPPSRVTIAHDDLVLLAEVAMLRFPLRGAESHRLEQMRTVLDAAADLARALESHTHCALVNHRGSHGTGDLAAETVLLSAALQRFGWLVAETAAEYRRFARERAVPVDPLALPRMAEGDVTVVVR
jgi:hypothetical protein